ncbi:hypothetical protein K440DRAFT_662921 [Wilcoxina mikolae CBS 423.85]|nr:hypothetical protein K440DRAFT_662921 [Wilcoxina mikolae CBS 423.85]
MLTARILRRGNVALSSSSVLRPYATTSGYGDPEQTGYGASVDHQSRASSTLEHPGPPPVDEGKETGSGGSNETGKVEGKKNTGNSSSDRKPKPKINPDSTPGGQGDKDVERHNKEMEERYDKKGKNDVDEKAGKGYWKGMGGRDRDP